MKNMILGVFETMSPNNGHPTWMRPSSRPAGYATSEYWLDIAKTLDRGNFDFLFFASSYGYPTINGVLPAAVPEQGILFPEGEPLLMISALAAGTSNLAFVVTSSIMGAHPYVTARNFATLDNLTGGRIGWNIVTGSAQGTSTALFGFDELTKHDDRYDKADEFVEVALKYSEGSWEPDAWQEDRERGVLVDFDKIHEVSHAGTHYRSRGYLSMQPGKQQTPVLFQAGTSERGRAFAGRNAESILIQGGDVDSARATVDSLRSSAVEAGRLREDIRVLSGVTVVTAPTTWEALAKREALEDLYSVESARIIFSSYTGVDMTTIALDKPVRMAASDLGQTLVDRFTKDNNDITVGEVIESFRLRGLRGFQITGDYSEVAHQLISIMNETDLDGFMLEPTFGGPEVYAEFVDFVLPLIEQLGGRTAGPRSETLRSRLFSTDDSRLSNRHYGAAFRPKSDTDVSTK